MAAELNRNLTSMPLTSMVVLNRIISSMPSARFRSEIRGFGLMFLVKFAFIIVLSLLSVEELRAASFDCGKAATPDEKTICSNMTLSGLDEEVAFYFNRAKSASGSGEVRKYARQLLSNRRSCGADAICIARMQIYSIATFKMMAKMAYGPADLDYFSDLDINSLAWMWSASNSDCRGYSSEFAISTFCNLRSFIGSFLEERGLCLGLYNLPFNEWEAQIAVRNRWVPCIYEDLVQN